MDPNKNSNFVRSNENTQEHLEGQRMSLESEEEIRARAKGLVVKYFERPFETMSIEEELQLWDKNFGIESVGSSTPPPTQVIVGDDGTPPELNTIQIEEVARDLEACKRGLDGLMCEKFLFHQEVMKTLTLKEEDNLKMSTCCLGLAFMQIHVCAVLYLYICCRAIERRGNS